MNQDTVVIDRHQAMEVTLKVALPVLLAGLIVGLAVSVFQAVTQIQEQTLSFIPKILALVARDHRRRAVDARPAAHLTTELYASIPKLVGT